MDNPSNSDCVILFMFVYLLISVYIHIYIYSCISPLHTDEGHRSAQELCVLAYVNKVD